MFDSHVHLLPGVDDGAKDEAQSLEMLEAAKVDGITHWIVTPHLGHACSRYSYIELKEKFDQWRETLRENSAYDRLVFGAEVYVDETFIEEISTMKHLPTFENSNYMLIEFNRSTKLEVMQAAIHELRLRGVEPVIAHVEAYPSLVKVPENVKMLCDDGALIQVSAGSIVDKRFQKLIQSLMGLGAIDMVASDGHNLSMRPPKMGDAYQVVLSRYSKAWADRLFIDTPKRLYLGQAYVRPVTKAPAPKRYFMGIVATIAIGVVIISSAFSQLGNQKPIPDSQLAVNVIETTTNSEAPEEYNLADESLPAGAASGSAEESTAASAGTTNETNTETTKANPPVTSPIEVTYDEVVNTYMVQLNALQDQYTADVARIYNAIQDTRNFVTDETKRKAIIDGYLEEVGALETQCDYNVYDVLYSFQNELEKHKYDVAIIEESRAKYHQIKEDTKNEYINNF